MKGYEYRIAPTDPYLVQVRRVNDKLLGERGNGWKTYYEAYSPQDARRILSMLLPEQVETTVTE